MSIATRLQGATQGLSPLQRALLVLQAVRDGKEPDPELRRIDDEQERRVFNRYMGLLWVINHQLGATLSVIEYRVEIAESHAHYSELFNEAAGLVDEHEAVRELAEYLADQREEWPDEDYEDTEEWGRVVSEAASDRAVDEEERRLRQLVVQGSLPAKGKGKGLKIQQGAFDDLLGCHVSAYIDGLDEHYDFYRVVPDSEAQDAAHERKALQHLQDVIEWRFGLEDEEMKRMPDLIMEGLKETLAYPADCDLGRAAPCRDRLGRHCGRLRVEDALMPPYREAARRNQEQAAVGQRPARVPQDERCAARSTRGRARRNQALG